MIAAAAHALNGDRARAAAWAANVRGRSATLNKQSFLRAFPMKVDAVRSRVLDPLGKLGF
jgi:hypothetical protein